MAPSLYGGGYARMYVRGASFYILRDVRVLPPMEGRVEWHRPCMGVVMPGCMSVARRSMSYTALFQRWDELSWELFHGAIWVKRHCIPRLLQPLGLPTFIFMNVPLRGCCNHGSAMSNGLGINWKQ